MQYFGYMGKVLWVNLSKKKIWEEDLDANLVQKFIGDFGLGAKLAFDLIDAGIDPLSPKNFIILGAGPLTGTSIPSSSRVHVFSKLPLTGTVGACGGGMGFSAKMKYAGYDHIIITGKSKTPVYLKVDEEPEICDATELWGKDLFDTTDLLWEKYGPHSGVTAIGPAGENRVNLSLALVDKYSSIGKGGLGAVFGSKNLKAIVARGHQGVQIADPERYIRLIGEIREEMMQYPTQEGDWGPLLMLMGQTHNMRESCNKKTVTEKFGPAVFEYRTRKGKAACPSCLLGCRDNMKVKSGKYKDLQSYIAGIAGRTTVLGLRLGMESIESVVKGTDLIQRYGLDSHALGGVVEFAQELYERGYIKEEELSGTPLMGSDQAVMGTLKKIAYREGIGDTLADGALGIIKKYGPETEKYSCHIKGLDAQIDPREIKMSPIGFSQVTNPRGGEAKPGMLDPALFSQLMGREFFEAYCDNAAIPKKMQGKLLNSKGQVNMARLTRHTEDFYTAYSSLGICMRHNIAPFYSMSRLSELYSAVTGINISTVGLKDASERVWNIWKLSNMKNGYCRKEDQFPVRWSEGLIDRDGDKKKKILLEDIYGNDLTNEKRTGEFMDDYYSERGWSEELGVPLPEKLKDIDLEQEGETLQKLKCYEKIRKKMEKTGLSSSSKKIKKTGGRV